MTDRWTEDQRRYFDGGLASYRELYARETPFQKGLIEQLLRLAGIRAGMRVVELGCGPGRVTMPLLRHGCRVTAVDISRPTLEHLQERVRNEDLTDGFRPLCADAGQLQLEEPVELVIGRGFLHHLRRPAPVLERARTLLQPGGRAVFMDPNPLQPLWLPLHLFHPALSLAKERYLWRGWPAWARRTLRAAGFRDVTSHFLGLLPPWVWHSAHLADILESWLEKLAGLRLVALYHVVEGRR